MVISAGLVFGIVVVGIIIGIIIMEWSAVKCPKCGCHMVYGAKGYDKYECLGCGHSKRY